ncbi:MAG: hypothetical protein JO000_03780 [Alphaproteobacteria bacterium]|nr:hypothetical protein [Alphaproteobacteria bacterium]
MSHAASLRVLITAAVATSVSVLTISLSTGGAARAEDTCLSAPKSAAPAGSHWRYRLERGTQRKCWHLAANGRQAEGRQAPSQQSETQKSATPRGRNAALRAEPQPQDDPQPQADAPAEKLTQTEPQPGPAPINDAVQRFTPPPAASAAPPPATSQNLGNTFAPAQAAPNAPAVPAADPQAAANGTASPWPSATDAAPRVNTEAQAADSPTAAAPAQPPAQPAPIVVSKRKAASSDVDTMRMLPFAIGALAASLVAAGFIFASASRRRHDNAIGRIMDLNAKEPPRRMARTVTSPPLAMREPWQDSWQDSRQDTRQDHESEEADTLRRPSPARQRAA